MSASCACCTRCSAWSRWSARSCCSRSASLNELVTGRPLRRANDAAVRCIRLLDAALRNAEVIQAMGMFSGLWPARWQRPRRDAAGSQAIASDRNAGD